MTASYPSSLSKYRLLARLGSGGMAEVYLAVAGAPGGFTKLSVLKLLRPDVSEEDRADFIRMFEDEACLAARLNHPNIVQSHEAGAEDGQHFIVMEFLDGQPLSNVQERAWKGSKGFPLEMQLLVLCQALEGLEYAHSLVDYDDQPLNIVHRDVSPQNVFITYAGQTKLVDFGIAKTLESSQTRAGVVKGKVPYMSPEQVLCEPLDRRSDLFSVGVMLWEAIAGRRMHGSASAYEISRRLVHGELPSIREAVPDVPVPLENILQRALAHKAADRYADAGAFRQDLVAFLDSFRRVNARQLGDYVTELFANERRRIGDIIRRGMQYETEPDQTPWHLRTARIPNIAAGLPSTPTPRTPQPAGQSTVPPVNLMNEAKPSPDRKKRWMPALVVLGAFALSAALVFALRSAHESDTRNTAAAPPQSDKNAESAPMPVHVEPPPVAQPTQNVGASASDDKKAPSPGAESSATKTRRADSTSGPTHHEAKAAAKAPADPFGEFPPPKRRKTNAPALDTSNPWSAE